MYRTDDPSDVKKGRIYIYYKNVLPLKVLSTNFLQERINFEVSIVYLEFTLQYRPLKVQVICQNIQGLSSINFILFLLT